MKTLIRLLLEEQSGQGLHCLLPRSRLLKAFRHSVANFLDFKDGYSNNLGVRKFTASTVALFRYRCEKSLLMLVM